jgi:hypothetical protein
MLSAIANTAKFAQFCPKLPKTAQNLPKSAQRQFVQETLKFHQKLRFCFFSRKNASMCRGGTKA